jgi:hypothetical protein
MKADQGIRGYKLTRVINDKKALLTAKIRIVPDIRLLRELRIFQYQPERDRIG